jgi:acid phosphatase family membrane protein YuiD
LEFRDFFKEIANNRVLWSTLFALLIAHILKGLYYFIREKKINFKRFFGAGGMPSSHSTIVAALTTSVGIQTGWDSIATAISIIVSMIVMYDASGVRRAAGRQAATLNKIIDELFEEGEFHQERLKELLGHTPVEVIAGATLGVVIAIIFG